MAYSAQHIKAGQQHLRKADPVMKALIRQVGPFTLRPMRDRFTMLVRSIVSQQISTAAAKTILNRLLEACDATSFTPERLLQFDLDQLRSLGVSRQKATYLLNLCEKSVTREIDLSSIGRCRDEEVIAQLTQVKGIGRWTAEMFLIFSLGRLDIFPFDDLGIRAAMARQYRLDEYPNKATAAEISEPWAPYRTIASWYLWRSLELPPTDEP